MTRILRSHLIAPVVVAVLAAFATPVVTAGPAAAEAPDVILVDPGSEPRAALRVHPHKGDVVRSTFTVTRSTTMRVEGEIIGEVDLGTVEGVCVTKVTGLTTDGGAVVTVSFTDVRTTTLPTSSSFDDDSGGAGLAAEAASVAQIEGVTMTSVVDKRNRFTPGDISGDDDLDDHAEDVFDTIVLHLDTQNVWFPAEPIGVGASWKLTSPDSYAGIDGTEEVVYTLESRTKDTVVVAYAFTRTASPGPIALPDMPEGATVDLQSLSFTGQGRLTVALDHPVMPTRSQGRVGGDMTMQLSKDSLDFAMSATVNSQLSLNPAPKTTAAKAKPGANTSRRRTLVR